MPERARRAKERGASSSARNWVSNTIALILVAAAASATRASCIEAAARVNVYDRAARENLHSIARSEAILYTIFLIYSRGHMERAPENRPPAADSAAAESSSTIDSSRLYARTLNLTMTEHYTGLLTYIAARKRERETIVQARSSAHQIKSSSASLEDDKRFARWPSDVPLCALCSTYIFRDNESVLSFDCSGSSATDPYCVQQVRIQTYTRKSGGGGLDYSRLRAGISRSALSAQLKNPHPSDSKNRRKSVPRLVAIRTLGVRAPECAAGMKGTNRDHEYAKSGVTTTIVDVRPLYKAPQMSSRSRSWVHRAASTFFATAPAGHIEYKFCVNPVNSGFMKLISTFGHLGFIITLSVGSRWSQMCACVWRIYFSG
ncbi:unnamed protein product [Trichogramma brassicae]|uniref:Uncharacterized protein n=1 Tax=Trichogramma brassicae TaxID=86971 RepID=A0A6H5IVD0_9HYME|nr:unnamed protein product [Trichogramma brassicae]